MFTSCCRCVNKRSLSPSNKISAKEIILDKDNQETVNTDINLINCYEKITPNDKLIEESKITEVTEEVVTNSKELEESSNSIIIKSENLIYTDNNVPDKNNVIKSNKQSSNNNNTKPVLKELPRKSSLKKRVNISEHNNEIVFNNNTFDFLNCIDDDDVFSDSLPSPLPRGDMCTPYPKKRGSMPGLVALPEWFNTEETEFGFMLDPPNTPIGRDELALKRHRFCSDLLKAAQAAAEHRVRFDPLGPTDLNDCDVHYKQSTTSDLEQLINRLETLIERLERTVLSKELNLSNQTLSINLQQQDCQNIELVSPVFVNNSLNMSVNGYEDIILGQLNPFLALSSKIGGDVALQSDLVKKAFNAQFEYIKLAAASAQPPQSKQTELLKPTSDYIAAIQSFREKNRTSQFFNHLSAISESIPALGWICVAPTPGPYVKEMNDAGQFYSNRVLKDWKEKDANHVEWTRAWVSTLNELQKYIKQYHTTGLVWSGKNQVSSGGPPPPPPGLPPPPPVMLFDDLSLNSGDDRNALFAQINQGEDITKSLKKVTPDMQTHKNTGLRSGPAPYVTPQPFKPTIAAKPGSIPKQPESKPPVFTRDGKKWIIEYQKSNNDLKVENAEMNNVVYMFKCENSTLKVNGKINSIIIDSCKKCSILFESLVSSIEFVNCQSVQMQVLGKVPTISIDKSDGCQMYLSQDSLDVEIVSSKSSEMNVLIPAGGDYTEQPIPEQFKTKIKGKSLQTVCVESLG